MRETYKCCNCGDKFPVQRSIGKKRPRNHIKTIWCIRCRKATPHKNVR